MSGVVFIICIPSEEREKFLQKKTIKKQVTIETVPEVIPIDYEVKSSNEKLHKEDIYEIKKENDSMQKILKNILEQLEITNSIWSRSEDQNSFQVVFPVDCSDKTEEILEILKENKIGKKYNSIVSVIPCAINYHGPEVKKGETDNEEEEKEDKDEEDEQNTVWNMFLSSVKSRLIVDQVVENVRTKATITFNFLMMLLISTSMCALGLVENSNIYLISSMLISPMMGPVMASTFGVVIKDKKLQKMGVTNELIVLGIAMLVGLFFGTIICVSTDKYGDNDWPTPEMVSRGELRTLWTGCLVALLSGATVALAVLSDDVASLVGVAISTSLMPPAVNAGLLWSMAAIYYYKGSDETTRYSSITRNGYYSHSMALELLSLGAVSLCLTLINIVCIYIAGILVFKIKEVAPISPKDSAKRRFWKHDLRMARDFNKTLQGEEAKQLFRAFSEQTNTSAEEKRLNELLHHSIDLPKDNFKAMVQRSEYTWSPALEPSKRSNLAELKEIYNEFQKNKPAATKSLNFQHFKPGGHHRKLSQIFSPIALKEEKLETINEKNSEKCSLLGSNPKKDKSDCVEKHFFSGNKKFTVTPCELDPSKE